MIAHRALAAAALAAAALAVAAGPAAAGPARQAVHAPARGSIGIRLVTVPVSERADPRARLYIIDRLKPGAVIRRRIQVLSTSASAARLSIYAAAAAIGHGQFLFAPGQQQNLMTTWVHLSRPVLRLAAGHSAQVTVAIRVPRNAPPGEQYGVIWAADRGANPGHANISLVSRVGVRIYLSVGPGNPPASNFTITAPATSRGARGRAIVTVRARNTGGRAVDITGTLTLTGGPGGLQAGPILLASDATLAPGQSAPVTFALSPAIPPGPWRALVTLRSGLIVRTEQSTIDFSARAPSTAGFPIMSWGAAGVAVLALIIIAGAITRAHRHRRPPTSTARRIAL